MGPAGQVLGVLLGSSLPPAHRDAGLADQQQLAIPHPPAPSPRTLLFGQVTPVHLPRFPLARGIVFQEALPSSLPSLQSPMSLSQASQGSLLLALYFLSSQRNHTVITGFHTGLGRWGEVRSRGVCLVGVWPCSVFMLTFSHLVILCST